MTNTNVQIKQIEVLADNWYTLRKVVFDYQKRTAPGKPQSREAYDRGNGAAILLFNPQQQTVILTRQFRMPTYLNGNASGVLIEVCAGLLDTDNPEDCIRRETEEETGYRVHDVRKVFELYMSPGSVTEILYFFVGEYASDMKTHAGGGAADEQENIEVLEMSFAQALEMMENGEAKDAKTVILLQYAQLNGLMNQ